MATQSQLQLGRTYRFAIIHIKITECFADVLVTQNMPQVCRSQDEF